MCYPWFSYYVDETGFYTINDGLVGHSEIVARLNLELPSGYPRIPFRGEYDWAARLTSFEDLRLRDVHGIDGEEWRQRPEFVSNRINYHIDKRFGDPERFMDWLSQPFEPGESVPLIIHDHLMRKDDNKPTAWERIIPMNNGGSRIATPEILDSDYGPRALDILRAVNSTENKLEQAEWLGELWNVFRPAWLASEKNRVVIWAK